MTDFNSKYTGEEIEGLLDKVSQGGSYPIEQINMDNSSYTADIAPNTYYVINAQIGGSITINLVDDSYNEGVKEYVFEIHGVSSCTIVFDESITWANGEVPVFDGDYAVVSIVNNLGVCVNFK